MCRLRGASFTAGLLLAAACAPAPEDLERDAAACAGAPARTLPGADRQFVALNAYYLQEEAARAIRRGDSSPVFVEETLREAAALGARAVRTWGFNDDPAKAGDSAIQIDKLVYDETALRGLDLVLARARAFGVQLVLPLCNTWKEYGGIPQYLRWAGLPSPREEDARFFTERVVIDHYKAHLKVLLDRVNTVDGLRYGDHPAVLAWELANEPASPGLDPALMRAWVDELGAHVKSLAPHHLVGTGEAGLDTDRRGWDRDFWDDVAGAWMFRAGTSFRLNTASPAVDYASVHLFPELWEWDPERIAEAGARWIAEHARIAAELGKPLLVGEFALPNDGAFAQDERRAIYRGWFRCARRAGVAAMAPWLFAYDARPEAWDRHTFFWRDGTAPGDPVNGYADLVLDAATPE